MTDSRARITVLAILLIITTGILSFQIYVHSTCAKCGNGMLEPGESIIDSMFASVDQNMYGNYYADGAPLVLAIIHEENYSVGNAINCTKCGHYVFDVEDVFNMIVSKDGIWYFILINTCRSVASYEYNWVVRSATDLIIDLFCWISIPSFIFLIIVQIVLIKKGKIIASRDVR